MNQRMLVEFNFTNLNNFIIYMDVEVSNNYDKVKLIGIGFKYAYYVTNILHKLKVQF